MLRLILLAEKALLGNIYKGRINRFDFEELNPISG